MTSNQHAPRGASKKWMWPAAIAAVVAAALVLAFATGGRDQQEQTSATLQQNAPATITGAALPSFEQTGTDPAVGTQAPTVEGVSFDGSPARITPGDGKRYLVAFLAHWCPHCQAEVPRLVDWFEAGGSAGLHVVAVSTAVNADQPNYPPSAWLAREQWPSDTWPVIVDSTNMDVAAAYGQAGFPFFVMLDADGTVLHRHAGELSREALEALIAETFGA